MSKPIYGEPDVGDLRSLITFAVRAPSSHNTQPWYFRIGEEHVLCFADRTRALPVNDPDDRELTISCGCALMNLRVAAARAGSRAQIRLLPGGEDEDLLARADLRPGPDRAEAELFPAILERRTYRKCFLKKIVPREVLEELVETANLEGAWFEVLDKTVQREGVVWLVTEGDAAWWANPSWRRELASWMHPRRHGDGLAMPGYAAPVVKAIVRTFDMGDGVGAKDKQLTEESPVLAVLGTDSDSTSDWLKAGMALERVLLHAKLRGLQASFLNQPIQVPALRPKLQHLLAKPGFPQILLRLGYPAKAIPASPRRSLDEVID